MLRRYKLLFKTIFLTMAFNIAFSEVTVTIGNVSVGGYTEDIVVPITVSNPNESVGGFQFDVITMPTIINVSDVSSVNENDFSADFNVFDDGTARVVFYSNTGEGIPAGGDEVVLNLHYNGMDVLSALVDLEGFNLTVSDADGDVIAGNIVDGSVTIGNVVFFSSDIPDTGDVLEQVSVDISIQNSSLVGGVQFDMYDTPNYLDVINLTTTTRTEGFQIEFNELANGATRVLLYGPDNQNIASGSGPIANMEMVVHDNAYNSNVGVNFENITITDDIGGSYWVAGVDSGTVTVTPGYIEEPHNLQAQDGMDAQVLLSWDPPYGPIPSDFNEDFEEGVVPEDWILTTNSAQGWFITQDGSSAFWTVPSHTWYMCSNDDMADDDGSVDYLITPGLNVSGAQNITLNFASYYDGAYGQTAHVLVSTDGVNFTEVVALEPSPEWVMETVDLSEFAGLPNLHVVFHSNDNGAWASGWAVDDVFITFAAREIDRLVHYELTELGQWALTAPKDEVMSRFGGGLPHNLKVDLSQPFLTENRPVELDAFKVYRSLNSSTGFQEIAEVGANTTSYLDEDVVNSTTYYYYVTAIYPDGSESGPTGTVSATPVEWVELWMDNGASLSGQMDTIDFYINNESDLGLFYFEIMDYPDVMNSLNILTTERTSSWALEIADQGDGTIAITGISIGTPLAPGDGSVCRAVLYPVADEEMTVNLSYTSGTSIQDDGFVDLNWTAEGSTYEVGIETQYLNLYGGYGQAGSSTVGSVFLQNTQPVYGIQFDILADPPFISGVDLNFNDILNLENWSYSGTDLGTGYRVTAYDNSMTNPIEPSVGHLVDITYQIFAGIPDSTIIDITVSDATLADVNNLPMHTEGTPHAFFVGQPSVGCTIENVIGQMSPGGTGTFQIHMENIETVNVLEFTILDMPDYMTVTNIELLDRFSDGTVDGNSGETVDGSFYFLGYDFVTYIEPGSGPIMEVDVQFNNTLNNPSVVFMIDQISAGDINALPLDVVADNFGQFINTTLSIDQNIAPGEYKLYANYPNPFNPATIITYDLAEFSPVELTVFDMRGRKIKNLFLGQQNPGQYKATWTGVDDYGKSVSAGVYIYKLKVSNKIFSRKMIMIK
ncbi:MAG: hypothetical protein CMG63_01665 [Candidatus Marinimicrobia bacterium]|nr:hypothetical protein [Candidatus Neomarinimicrobiota bacterium]